jgi:arginine/serine-rich splicing factor 1/9
VCTRYGRIREIDIKNQGRPPAFAFVVFDDYRDAEDAIRARDGYMFDGARLRVEMSRGGRDRDRVRDSGRDGGRDGGRERDRDRGKTGGKRTDFGVVVSGLPRSCSSLNYN